MYRERYRKDIVKDKYRKKLPAYDISYNMNFLIIPAIIKELEKMAI